MDGLEPIIDAEGNEIELEEQADREMEANWVEDNEDKFQDSKEN